MAVNREAFVEAFVKAALSSVGEREDPPGSNRGPQIEKYLAGWQGRYGSFYRRGAKWCGLFAEYHLRAACAEIGLPCPVPEGYWLGSKAEWERLGNEKGWLVADPARGDVVVLRNAGQPYHLGIVYGRGTSGELLTVEGNSGDQVKLHVRPYPLPAHFVRVQLS